MPMQMGWRWYGEDNDPITLSDIKQIPGVTSIVWALHHKMPGEIWEENEIKEVMDQIHAYGFNGDVVESVNVHDDIKIGLPTRDQYIENYKQCIRNLSKFGVKVICYNFMPIFDWTRTDLFHPVGDGSTALFYQKDMIKDDYKAMAKYILDFTEKYHMTFPGWEPERMAKLDELFKAYAPVTKEKLWDNLKYFLEAIMPSSPPIATAFSQAACSASAFSRCFCSHSALRLASAASNSAFLRASSASSSCGFGFGVLTIEL